MYRAMLVLLVSILFTVGCAPASSATPTAKPAGSPIAATPATGPAATPTAATSQAAATPTAAATKPAATLTVAAAQPAATPTVAAAQPASSPTTAATKPAASPAVSAATPTVAATKPAATSQPATQASPAAGAVEVAIQGFVFSPNSLTVAVGTSVTWTNKDAAPHTATANNGAFDTGNLAQGQSFSFKFTQPGNFPYKCSYHPNMLGTIVVQ